MEKVKTICDHVATITKSIVGKTIQICQRVSSLIKNCYYKITSELRKKTTLKSLPVERELLKVEVPKKKKITLDYFNPQAKEVKFAANFINWSPIPMEKKNGLWSTLELSPGQYLYKFIVDNQWIKDPKNTKTQPDGFGGLNSVLEVI